MPNACRLLAKPEIQDLIAALKQERADRLEIETDDVLRRLWHVATADTNEVIQYRRLCCRYCYGTGFQCQRTAGECERDHALWQAEELKASQKDEDREPTVFNEMGGVGYHKLKRPNPECPECFGEGVGDVFIPDSRDFSPAARALYAGVKQTKEGLEVKTNSQSDALVKVGQHLGMFKEVHDHNHKGVVGIADISEAVPLDQQRRIAEEMLREAGYEFD